MGQILNSNDNHNVQSFHLNSFGSDQSSSGYSQAPQDQAQTNQAMDAILAKLDMLNGEIATLKNQNTQIQTEKLNNQIIEALTTLNNHSKQFDKITKAFEDKLISYSLKIATKIIQQEVQQNSNQIALNFATDLIAKLKDATSIQIHVNPIDYEHLLANLDLADTIELVKDTNVSPSGIVVSSDIGNFDATIESKLDTLASSIDTIS